MSTRPPRNKPLHPWRDMWDSVLKRPVDYRQIFGDDSCVAAATFFVPDAKSHIVKYLRTASPEAIVIELFARPIEMSRYWIVGYMTEEEETSVLVRKSDHAVVFSGSSGWNSGDELEQAELTTRNFAEFLQKVKTIEG